MMNNSEFLLCIDAKDTNPNGDPDFENRPRIDFATMTNYVSDVRIKRYLRDYIINNFGQDYIWVTTVDGKNVDATQRLNKLNPLEVPKKFYDARIFGATIPIKNEKGSQKGDSASFTGPIQITWGYSLHPVELIDSSGITSVFSGRTPKKSDQGGEAKQYGNIGKDYRIYYSLLAFYGAVSGNRASFTNMNDTDLRIFDYLISKSIMWGSKTRSKIGVEPITYVRVEYKDPRIFLGDPRAYIGVRQNSSVIRKRGDVTVDYTGYIEILKKSRDKINKIIVEENNGDELRNLLSNAGFETEVPQAFDDIKRELSRY